jgi:hypothetical protein
VTLLEPVPRREEGDDEDTTEAENDSADAKTFDFEPLNILPSRACPVPEEILHRISASETQTEASH